MNARLLFAATTLSVTAAMASIAGCTINASDDKNDASTNTSSSSSSGGGVTDGGATEASTTDGGVEAGEAGACLGSTARGPFCEKDETPEVPAKCAKECDVASTSFNTEVAAAISDCIDEAIGDQTPNDDLCEKAAGPCVTAATAEACPNDVSAYCDSLATKCPTTDSGNGNFISKAECLQYFRGATLDGKQLLLTCLEQEKADPKVCAICMTAIKTVHNGD